MSLPRVAREAVTLPRSPGIHAGEVHVYLLRMWLKKSDRGTFAVRRVE